VGGWEKFQKQKKKQQLRLGLRKGKETKINLGWHMDRKEKPISAPSIPVGALVGVGSFWLIAWAS
jgi:hypothetical protein